MTQNLRATLIFLILIPLGSIGQSKLSLEIFGTPFISRYGGITNTGAYFTDHPNITTENIYHPSQEAGIIFNQTFKNKFGWSTGVSWTNDFRSLRLNCFDGPADSLIHVGDPLISISKDIKIQRIAFKLGCSYSFNDKIQLDFLISTHFKIHENITPEWDLNFIRYDYTTQTNLHVQIYKRSTIDKPQIIPELKFSFEILKGLRFNMGTRLKLWGPSYMVTTVRGSFETIDYSDEILQRSYMSGGDFRFFAGISYRLELNKN